MQESIQSGLFKKNILKHVFVLSIFLILTLIITFPVVLDFTTEAAGNGCYDKCHMMWRIWWADFSNDNNLDFYHSEYIFQPNGVTISGNLAQFTTIIGAVLYDTFGNTLTWNIIWLTSFVFGGYGSFLLANHFTRNPYASLIGGIVFTFSTYHLIHSQMHIGLSMIVWLPLFILVLFKILEKNSKILIILGVVFLFLASMTHIWFFAMLVMFSIMFFTIHIFKQKNVANKVFIINFSLILGIGILVSLAAFTPILNSESNHAVRTLDEHIKYSGGLGNLFTPTFLHSSQIHSGYSMIIEMYNLLDEDIMKSSSIESKSYLGYPVIFLSILALKFRFRFSWFWVFSGVGFAILSLGPELKIFNTLTGIWLPERILFDYVPGWDEFRAPGRFIILTHLSLGVLSAFAVNGIMKSGFFSKKIMGIILIVIIGVIVFDVSANPYPSYTEPIPKIYEEIKNDSNDFVILEAPLGAITTERFLSHPTMGYYQTFHEKPIIGGYESRGMLNELEQNTTYFLKNFQLFDVCKPKFGCDFTDIIKQDLGNNGIAIFNNFNIKYVIIHKDEIVSRSDLTTQRLPVGDENISEISNLMSKILDNKKPHYEDDRLVVYKIPRSEGLEPFILLGDGWHEYDATNQTRAMYPMAEIKIINPKNTEIEYSIKIKLEGYDQDRQIEVSLNGKYLQEFHIPVKTTTLELNKLKLLPGENTILINSNSYDIWLDPAVENGRKISLITSDISRN